MFLVQSGGLGDGRPVKTLSKIEQIELSIQQEKRRMAERTQALADAKAQKLVQQQLTKVRKEYSFLDQMTGQLSMTTQKEIDEKQRWESEWNHKIDTFKQQHFELQRSLEKKQLVEMRRLQEDLRRRIKKLNDDVTLMGSQGHAPSPRGLIKVQEENVEKVVQLFQQHAQERLQLTEKVAKQENLLMQSRGQSLQRFFMEAQTKSENLYQRFNPKQTIMPGGRKLHLIMDSSDKNFDRLHTSASDGMQEGPPKLVMKAPPSRKDLHTSRASTSRLLSPRIEVYGVADQMTFSADFFLPGEDDDGERLSPGSTMHKKDFRNVSFDRNQSNPIKSMAATETSMVHSMSTDVHGGVLHHNQSFGDQAAHRRQNQVENSLRRPLYTGAHGRLGKDDAENELLPIPGTEQTGWKTINNKAANSHEVVRGTNTGGIRRAYISQTVSSQYLDSSAKLSKGTITHMGDDKRLQKASGASYKVPLHKLGLSMNKTLPTVRARTKEEKEERRKNAPHSVLDPVSNPKSPDWGTVNLETRSPIKRKDLAPSEAASVDQIQEDGHQGHHKIHLQKHTVHQEAHVTKEDPKVVSENFSQLEAWVEEKIRHILSKGGNAAPVSRPVSQQGEDRKLTSSQGRSMRTSSAIPQAVAKQGGTGTVLPAVGRISSGGTTGDGSIGKLLTRLKTTMATDAAQVQPEDKRKHREVSNLVVGDPLTGIVLENSKAREKDDAKHRELMTGQEVPQMYEDMEIMDFARGDLKVSGKAKENRDKLGKIDTSGAHHAITPKTPKRVGFTLDEEEDYAVDAFRPETGYSQQSMYDRPETSVSSYHGEASRPATMSSRPETGRPGNWGNDQAESEPENTEKIKTDVFGNIRHNKVAQVEDAFAAGFPIDSRDEHGNTALHISCQNGQKRLAKLCIKYGANPDTTNHMGNTSLHYAIGYGYEALSKYLISHGADDSIMNLNGQSPYEMVDKK